MLYCEWMVWQGTDEWLTARVVGSESDGDCTHWGKNARAAKKLEYKTFFLVLVCDFLMYFFYFFSFGLCHHR